MAINKWQLTWTWCRCTCISSMTWCCHGEQHCDVIKGAQMEVAREIISDKIASAFASTCLLYSCTIAKYLALKPLTTFLLRFLTLCAIKDVSLLILRLIVQNKVLNLNISLTVLCMRGFKGIIRYWSKG